MVAFVGLYFLAVVVEGEVGLSLLTIVVGLVFLFPGVVGGFVAVVVVVVVEVQKNYSLGLLVWSESMAGGNVLACHIFEGIRG